MATKTISYIASFQDFGLHHFKASQLVSKIRCKQCANLNDHDGHLAELLKRCVLGVGTVARNAHKGKI
ncbi:cytochrome c-type biogenesis protein CcmH/NrfF [Rhodoferax ferrireducens]|uniref:Cytochrome c-type biogenesis protein CcmH/NrfF n=1 Tax=Rhodoferax ferrireducens TaxID=192843 RepID=A0ABU2CFC3_9BURK|nr:hypothetical protein [Rhodoferax ferrireducens]MDR7380032.1 cytochrome c-type biogenesis protein CcmH/NrfF [Rhodoferax ferrireducens]